MQFGVNGVGTKVLDWFFRAQQSFCISEQRIGWGAMCSFRDEIGTDEVVDSRSVSAAMRFAEGPDARFESDRPIPEP